MLLYEILKAFQVSIHNKVTNEKQNQFIYYNSMNKSKHESVENINICFALYSVG